MQELSISIRFVRAALKHAARAGADPIAVLRKNRISPRLLFEEDARISIERFANFQQSLVIEMGDEAIGYTSRPLLPGTWSMMNYAVINCTTLEEALQRLCQYFVLLDCGVHCALVKKDEHSFIDFYYTKKPSRYGTSIFFFNIHRFASWLIEARLPLVEVKLQDKPWAQAIDYRHMFQGSRVEFEQPHNQLVFSNAYLAKPLKQNEQTLKRFLRHPALALMSLDYRHSSWGAKVREILRRDLADMPELNEVSELLHVHPQTLRRRLAAEGSSYKELKNQLRRDTALHYLGKRSLSIEEVAHRAGFSESSAFIRAFKGWTGVTPYTYRKGL